MKNKNIYNMQLDLMISDEKIMRVSIEIRTGTLFPKSPEIFKLHDQIRDIDGMKCTRVVNFNNYMDGGLNGLSRTAIRNDRICIIWDNDYDFETLKLDLKLLKQKEIEHNSLIIKHKKCWYSKPEFESVNLYGFIVQLLITEYKKGDVLELENFKPYLKGMYITINKDNIAVLSKNYNVCAMANITGMEV